jgi:tetratricopeptide (TPR) repeat protein
MRNVLASGIWKRTMVVALILACTSLFTADSMLLAQQDQSKTETQKLIEQAGSIVDRGLDSITQEEALKAISLYEEARALAPQALAAWDYERLSRLYESLGNWERAVEVLQQVLDIYPYDFLAILSVAVTYEEYGMLNEAEFLAYKAIALEYGQYDQALAYEVLGRIYRQQGKDELADWAEDLSTSLAEEDNKRTEEYYGSLSEPEPYEYPLAVAIYLAIISLIALVDYFWRKQHGKKISFKRDATLLCVITALLSSPFVIVYPWADVVSIPVAVLMFVIPQIGVLTIATVMHYRVKLGFDART